MSTNKNVSNIIRNVRLKNNGIPYPKNAKFMILSFNEINYVLTSNPQH